MKARICLDFEFDVNLENVEETKKALQSKLDDNIKIIKDSIPEINFDDVTLTIDNVKPHYGMFSSGGVTVWDENDHSHPVYCCCQECKDNSKGHFDPTKWWNQPEYHEKCRKEDEERRIKEKKKKKWFNF